MRAVLDSSVLASAFFTPQGTCADLLRAADHGAFTVCLSRELIADLTRPLLNRPKLQERYGYDQRKVALFLDRLRRSYEVVSDLPDLTGAVPLDPKDDVIVATAIAAHADYLVTGDRKHLLALGGYEGIQIVTPRAFLEALTKRTAG